VSVSHFFCLFDIYELNALICNVACIITFGYFHLRYRQCSPSDFLFKIVAFSDLLVWPVLVTQWANALSEPQCTVRPDWLETCDGLGSIPHRGVGFSAGCSNSGHVMRLIS